MRLAKLLLYFLEGYALCRSLGKSPIAPFVPIVLPLMAERAADELGSAFVNVIFDFSTALGAFRGINPLRILPHRLCALEERHDAGAEASAHDEAKEKHHSPVSSAAAI
jgi:hypothetical protein